VSVIDGLGQRDNSNATDYRYQSAPPTQPPGGRLATWERAAEKLRQVMETIDLDLEILNRCLWHQPHGWEDFVDRFMGQVLQIIDYTLRNRDLPLAPEQSTAVCEQVFEKLAADDFRLLRQFHGDSRLSTYITVLVHRLVLPLLPD